MKLNRNGYMLVEIVIASVLAFGIAYYLLNLTYKFKNTNMDVQESIIYINNKNVITKNIMNDLENIYVKDISDSGTNYIVFDIKNSYVSEDGDIESEEEKRGLVIEKTDDGTVLKYGKLGSDYVEGGRDIKYDVNDVSYYEKTLSSILIVGNINVDYVGNGLGITIPISSIYDDGNYDIKLFAFWSNE